MDEKDFLNMADFKLVDESFYKTIKEVLENARKRIYRNIQSEMVQTYWQIGKMIVEKQGGNNRAKYGENLIKELSSKMIKDFGKGYTPRNLWYMKQLYLTFPIFFFDLYYYQSYLHLILLNYLKLLNEECLHNL